MSRKHGVFATFTNFAGEVLYAKYLMELRLVRCCIDVTDFSAPRAADDQLRNEFAARASKILKELPTDSFLKDWLGG